MNARHRPARPRPGDLEQKRRIGAMFDGVAHRYDLLNHVLSAGIDVRWRRRTVRAMELRPGHRLLDLCAGTGDLGFEALRLEPKLTVIGVDLAGRMLARGEAKRGEASYWFVRGDAERMPLSDGSVDRACVGFGIRNVASLACAFDETARVLAPGGIFAVLEFTTPPNRAFRALYHAYFHGALPVLGGLLSGRRDAYAYLPESVAHFPEPSRLAEIATKAGFREVRWRLLSGGIAALHVCRR